MTFIDPTNTVTQHTATPKQHLADCPQSGQQEATVDHPDYSQLDTPTGVEHLTEPDTEWWHQSTHTLTGLKVTAIWG